MDYFFNSGTAYTPYNNTRTIQTRSCTGCWNNALYDDRDIKTYQAYGTFNSQYDVWIDGDNDWDDNVDKQEAGGAHWAAEMAFDYYANTKSYIKPFWTHVTTKKNLYGKIGAWKPEQNYPNEDRIYVDLQYNGSSCAALDIIGHEFTHAINNKHSKVGVGTNDLEPRALSEGFADIFGSRIESYTLNWGMEWDWGNNLPNFKRSFFHPFLDIPDESATVYGGTHFTDGHHEASGPLRTWFAHVSSGNWNWGNLQPLSLPVAEDFTWFLFAYCLNTYSNYQHAYTQSMNIAWAFWGQCTPRWKAVEKAWHDVGIGAISPCRKFIAGADNAVVTVSFDAGNPTSLPRPAPGPERITVKGNTLPGELQPERISYTWQIPSAWHGRYNIDSSIYFLDSMDDLTSRFVSVIVNYEYDGDPYTDTLISTVHFAPECSTEPQAPAYRKASGNGGHIISSVNVEPEISIYPNPASTYLNVVLGQVDRASLTISNISGREFYSAELKQGMNTINLPQMVPGVYFVRLKGAKINIVKKITIQ